MEVNKTTRSTRDQHEEYKIIVKHGGSRPTVPRPRNLIVYSVSIESEGSDAERLDWRMIE